jgi:hypothetical protein
MGSIDFGIYLLARRAIHRLVGHDRLLIYEESRRSTLAKILVEDSQNSHAQTRVPPELVLEILFKPIETRRDDGNYIGGMRSRSCIASAVPRMLR